MALKQVLGSMLASRLMGRRGARGGLGAAAMLGGLGMLGGRRSGGGGLGRKAGLAALGYMAYRAWQDRQPGNAGHGGDGNIANAGGGLGELIGDIAGRFRGTATDAPGAGEMAPAGPTLGRRCAQRRPRAAPDPRDDRRHALRRPGVGGRARPHPRPSRRGRAQPEDSSRIEREIERPLAPEALLAEVHDRETAERVCLAASAAVDGTSQAQLGYLQQLRAGLGLSEADVAEIEGLAR